MKITQQKLRFLFGCFLVLCSFIGTSAFAQTKLTGTVISKADGETIIGAAVQIQGTGKGTVTDFDGKFTLNGPNKGVLVITYMGFKTIHLPYKPGKKTFKVMMVEDTKELEDVVVIGYGTMRKKEVSGAVARLGGEDLQKVATSDIGNALQGQIAGVNVQAGTGGPGSKANIQIRGLNSISGGNAPLYVVDGIPYEGDPGLSDNEIESIDVLKDAASAAIYGTRGAGGVILITTKKGKAGQFKINFHGYAGVQKITSDMELMNTNEYLYVQNLKQRLDEGIKFTDDQTWSTLQQYSNNFFNNTNVFDIVQSDYAPIQNYALNLSGGRENITYNLAGSVFMQDGVIINSNFKRYSLRSNTVFKKGNWTVTSIIGLKREDKQSPAYNMLVETYKYKPTQTYLHPDMTISNMSGQESELNSLSQLMGKFKEDNQTATDNFTGNISIDYAFNKNLKFTTRGGINYTNATQTIINPLFELYDQNGELRVSSQARSGYRENRSRNTGLTWENILNYNKQIKKHKLTLTGVYSMEQYTYSSIFAQVKDLSTNEVPSINVGTSDMLVGTGKGQWGQNRTSAMIGMLVRGQYNYANRYLFSASVRRDGSSRFADGNRWGMFPSGSVAWNVSEEKFWKPLLKTVNSFKIRASYGTTGNQNFADYAYASSISNNYDYAFGSAYYGDQFLSKGMIQAAYSNPDVKWETTQQYNFGVDLALFKNKFTVGADVYQSDKSNMLFPMPIPPTAGVGNNQTVVLNVGNMRNRGIELALGYRGAIRNKAWYNLKLTASRNINTITKMTENSEMFYFADGFPVTGSSNADKVTAIKEGYEAGAFFMMPTNGIVNTEEKLVEYQKLYSSARMGDLMYVDVNKDGKIDDKDRCYAGSGMPEVEMGLNASINYKGFDFSMNWYASIGNEIINGTEIFTYQQGTSKKLVHQWSEVNYNSQIPANRGTNHNNYRGYADVWVEDGSFLRLKNISLGYALPKRVLPKMKLSKLRFYVAADNLLTITPYQGYDPEVGSNGLSKRGLDLGTYPISMQVRGGIQLDF